jgi:hypothetical protein
MGHGAIFSLHVVNNLLCLKNFNLILFSFVEWTFTVKDFKLSVIRLMLFNVEMQVLFCYSLEAG